MAEHKRVPLRLLKLTMLDSFKVWCAARDVGQTNENLIEFMIQRGFLKGKQFRKYIDGITIMPSWFDWEQFPELHEPLREGFIPPDKWI